ncbi:hypothetical protein JL475_00120 [Streptomyces sp. M2CJ-2]|uniref:hypothetical protein n=1 Tax=Streptomyces sp. M2CJ-2 TaxID=2803948 RepID=UPI001923F795|nr:hypothetical protein [Streptomyces sp. M2CJ-2]MBL3664450.1 hypothetical protein [Streptomyces sp. M2CJ-2]
MSITESLSDLIPALKGTGRRRAIDKVEELRDENRRLLAKLVGVDDAFALLHQELAEARREKTETEEIIVAQLANLDRLTVHRDELLAQVTALTERFGPELAAEANANRVDVPPMMPIGADQDTAPIDVRPLWDAADAGLLGPVTDPGHVPDLGVEDTQPIPAA